jgi:hypothetical protein
MSKGLMCHVKGLAQQLATLEECNGTYFQLKLKKPLSKKELDEYYIEQDIYKTKQAQVCNIIYKSVSKSVFLKVKNEATAADVCKKVIAIHKTKGTMSFTDTLTQLSNLHYADDKGMHNHILTMQEV